LSVLSFARSFDSFTARSFVAFLTSTMGFNPVARASSHSRQVIDFSWFLYGIVRPLAQKYVEPELRQFRVNLVSDISEVEDRRADERGRAERHAVGAYSTPATRRLQSWCPRAAQRLPTRRRDAGKAGVTWWRRRESRRVRRSAEAREERVECILLRQVEPSLHLLAVLEPHDRDGFEHLGLARDGGAEALEGHDVVVRP
jgi:hypothetical protein